MTADLPADPDMAPSDILHPGSRALFRYWESIRGERPAPARADLDLRPIKAYVPSLFIAEASPRGYRWRLAGTRVCELWRRELTGTQVFAVWERFERETAQRLFDGVIAAMQPCVLRLKLITSLGHAIGIELIGLPLVGKDGAAQVFGSAMAFRDTAMLGYDRIASVELASARTIWTEPLPSAEPSLARPTGKSFGAFEVIKGGR